MARTHGLREQILWNGLADKTHSIGLCQLVLDLFGCHVTNTLTCSTFFPSGRVIKSDNNNQHSHLGKGSNHPTTLGNVDVKEPK